MAIVQRSVVGGPVYHTDGAVWTSAPITATLTRSGYTASASVLNDRAVTALTGSDGMYTLVLWADETSAVPVRWLVTEALPTNQFAIDMPAGPDGVHISGLRASSGVNMPGNVIQTAIDAFAASPQFVTAVQAAATAGTGYTHTQSTPATTWIVNHNLGFRPDVMLYTVGGVVFDAGIQNISLNQLQITMKVALAGTARCS